MLEEGKLVSIDSNRIYEDMSDEEYVDVPVGGAKIGSYGGKL